MDKLRFAKIYKVLGSSYEWFDANDSFKLKLWHEALSGLDEELLTTVVLEWIKTETKPPTIADLIERTVQKVNGFVSAEESWMQSYDEKDEIGKSAHWFVGGQWAIDHSTSPEIIRSQYLKAYNSFLYDEKKKQGVDGIPPEKVIGYRKSEGLVRIGDTKGLGIVE